MLAAEVAVALPLLLHPGELRVLAHLPVRVRALCPRVRGPEVDRGAPGPMRRDVLDGRKQRLELGHELLGARRQGPAAEARAHLAARIVDEDARILARVALRARDFPRVLVAGVGESVAVVPGAIPEAVLELD